MAEVADRVNAGTLKRVIINLPYRQLKSETWSRDFPAFFAGNHPDKKIATISHVHRLARGFGRDVRNALGTKSYHLLFPRVTLAEDSFAKDLFHIQREKEDQTGPEPIQGTYLATSVQGSIMGEGVDLGVLDDLHKDYLHAQDRRHTDEVWEYITQVFFNRLMPGASIVDVGQRLSDHDVHSRLAEHWRESNVPHEIIELPAVADADGRAIQYDDIMDLPKLRKGKVLWDYYDIDYWCEQAITMGPSAFMAMAQQKPNKFTGQIIHDGWMVHWSLPGRGVEGRRPLPDRFDRMLTSWDLRFKSTTSGSYVVGQVWGQAGPYKYKLDQVRGQWGFNESIKNIKALRGKWPEARKTLIEAKANAHAAEEVLSREIAGIELVDPGTLDKASRMRATEPDWASHHVLLPPPEAYPYIKGYKQRLAVFPAEPNDEGDATSQALNFMSGRRDVLGDLTAEG